MLWWVGARNQRNQRRRAANVPNSDPPKPVNVLRNDRDFIASTDAAFGNYLAAVYVDGNGRCEVVSDFWVRRSYIQILADGGSEVLFEGTEDSLVELEVKGKMANGWAIMRNDEVMLWTKMDHLHIKGEVMVLSVKELNDLEEE